MIPALLKWIGNKQRFAQTIVSYMPNQFSNYYEPFLGSGAVMAELLYSDRNMMFPHFERAYGSDILPFLIEVFEYVKDSPEQLSDYYKKQIEEYYFDPIAKYDETLATTDWIFVYFQGRAIQESFALEKQMVT